MLVLWKAANFLDSWAAVFLFEHYSLLLSFHGYGVYWVGDMFFLDYLFSNIRDISRKANISYVLINTRMCAYYGVRNVSFPEDFPYVLHGYSLGRSEIGHLARFCFLECFFLCVKSLYLWKHVVVCCVKLALSLLKHNNRVKT